MKQSDQTRAKRLLKIRSEGATFRWSYLFKSKRLWLGIIIVPVIMIYATGTDDIDFNRIAFFLFGILFGRIARDIIWLKDVVDGFPFLEKILNWHEVEKIAEEK